MFCIFLIMLYPIRGWDFIISILLGSLFIHPLKRIIRAVENNDKIFEHSIMSSTRGVGGGGEYSTTGKSRSHAPINHMPMENHTKS